MSYLFSLLVSVSNLGVCGTFVPDGDLSTWKRLKRNSTFALGELTVIREQAAIQNIK